MSGRIPRRRPHAARRARHIVAGISAAAFFGLGGVMARRAERMRAPRTAAQRDRPPLRPRPSIPSGGSSTATTGPGRGLRRHVAMHGDRRDIGDIYGDTFGDGQSSDGWGAQPPSNGQAFGSGGGGDTSPTPAEPRFRCHGHRRAPRASSAGRPTCLARRQARVADLEARWSRFLDDQRDQPLQRERRLPDGRVRPRRSRS